MAYNAPLYGVYKEKLAGTGYSYESHEATTEDGYILTLVRLIKTDEDKETRSKRAPILFQHGFTACSESWFLTKHPKAQPIVL